MSLEELYSLSPRQYYNKVKGHSEQFNEEEENNLRRARFIAFYISRGWNVKNNRIKKPEDIFKLSTESVDKKELPPLTTEEAIKLAKRWQKIV